MQSITKPTNRLLDPLDVVRRDVERRQGIRSSREIERGIGRAQRAGSPPPVPHPGESFLWYRADAGASGDATYTMSVGVPSSLTAWAMTTMSLPLPATGRVVGGRLWAGSARTAGSAQLIVEIVDNNRTTPIRFPGVVLNNVATQRVAKRLPWEKCAAFGFAKNATIRARVVTTGSYATAAADTFGDLGAMIFVEYDV